MSSLTTQQFREQYGEPHVVAVTRTDGGEIPPGVPTDIVVPTWLCRPTNRFMLDHGHILLSDFGESFSPFSHVRLGRDCHSPIYAAPAESMFDPDAPLSFSADIWSLAVAIWDIVGMGSLFYNALTTQDENMAQMIDLLGPPPASWLDRWEARSDFFDDDGCPKDDRDVWPNLEDAFEKQVQRKRYEMSRGEFGDEEAAAFLDMMTQMLRFTPEHRPTARRILGCEWMTKWARQDSLGPGREIPQSFVSALAVASLHMYHHC